MGISFGEIFGPLSALVRKVPILGIFQDITLPEKKKKKQQPRHHEKNVGKKQVEAGKHTPLVYEVKTCLVMEVRPGELKTGSGSPKNSFNLARFAIGYYINYS